MLLARKSCILKQKYYKYFKLKFSYLSFRFSSQSMMRCFDISLILSSNHTLIAPYYKKLAGPVSTAEFELKPKVEYLFINLYLTKVFK